ncbi:MAG TPA: hypothetical protein VK548_03555 [Candidatus Acidoferrum sp.]|nr:hypothetical protein [Candidatus Acidoferrum sp.]
MTINLYADVGNDPIDSSDPLGLRIPSDSWRATANLYAYVTNAPLNFRDPLGLEKQGCGFGSILASSFRQRRTATNAALFGPLAQTARFGVALTFRFGNVTAGTIGTVSPLQALFAVVRGQGVANLTVGATAASGALTGIVTAIATTAALEAGVIAGSAAGALGEAIGQCIPLSGE